MHRERKGDHQGAMKSGGFKVGREVDTGDSWELLPGPYFEEFTSPYYISSAPWPAGIDFTMAQWWSEFRSGPGRAASLEEANFVQDRLLSSLKTPRPLRRSLSYDVYASFF